MALRRGQWVAMTSCVAHVSAVGVTILVLSFFLSLGVRSDWYGVGVSVFSSVALL